MYYGFVDPDVVDPSSDADDDDQDDPLLDGSAGRDRVASLKKKLLSGQANPTAQ